MLSFLLTFLSSAFPILSAVIFGFILGSLIMLAKNKEKSKLYIFFDDHRKWYDRFTFTTVLVMIACIIGCTWLDQFVIAAVYVLNVAFFVLVFFIAMGKLHDDVIIRRGHY